VNKQLADSTVFLVPVRDPIDRVVSAFNYQLPENTLTKLNCKGVGQITNAWRAIRYRFTIRSIENDF